MLQAISGKHLGLRQRQARLVFGRQLWREPLRPIDADGRVVPGDAAFVGGGVVVGGFVQEVCCV